MMENACINVKNRSHTITAEVDIPSGGANGDQPEPAGAVPGLLSGHDPGTAGHRQAACQAALSSAMGGSGPPGPLSSCVTSGYEPAILCQRGDEPMHICRGSREMSVAWLRSAWYAWMILLGLALLAAPDPASAQPVEIPATWGGDFWSRPRLTGNWGGLRDELGKKGVVFDVDLLLTPQWRHDRWPRHRRRVLGQRRLHAQRGHRQAGLWPGGFLKVFADSSFGNNVLEDSGAFVPVNTPALLPTPDDPTTALMHADIHAVPQPEIRPVGGQDLHPR